MSAGQLSAATVFEVKCQFAIDAIAAVNRAGAPFFTATMQPLLTPFIARSD